MAGATDLSTLPVTLTVEETAAVFRIGRSAAYAAIRSGEIPAIRVGRTLRVPRHVVEALLAAAGSPSNETANSAVRSRSSRMRPEPRHQGGEDDVPHQIRDPAGKEVRTKPRR